MAAVEQNCSRAEKIAQLRSFQERDLSSLRSRLAELDADIVAAEAAVLHASNVASAARGLVGQRGGIVPEPARTSSRARPKQRLWARKDGSCTRHEEETVPPEPGVRVSTCGVVYSPFRKRFEAPRQSFTGCAGRATVLLTWGKELLEGLRKGERLWILYWLDRNDGLWRHFVRPPRAKGGWRVGVFATRSPNRPSPIGLSLSVVEEVDVEQGRVEVSGVDVLDETPLLGLKRYESDSEAWPDAKAGWIDQVDRLQPLYYDEVDEYADVREFEVVVEEQAEERLRFIDERSAIDVGEMVRESLKRVIVEELADGSDGGGKGDAVKGSLPVGAFRVLYDVRHAEDSVVVKDVVSGMRRTVCEQEAGTDPEALLHLEFQDLFSEGTQPVLET